MKLLGYEFYGMYSSAFIVTDNERKPTYFVH